MASPFLTKLYQVATTDAYYIKSICPSGGHMAAGIASRYKTGPRARLETYR